MNSPLQDQPHDIATFMGSPLGDLADIEASTAVVVGVPSDLQTERHGAGIDAARAIREASLAILAAYTASPSRTLVDPETGRASRLRSPLACLDLGDLLLEPSATIDLADTVGALAHRITDSDALPVFIGASRAMLHSLLAAHRGDDEALVLLVSHDLHLPGSAVGGPLIGLGVNGLQDEARWRSVTANGMVISADDIHDQGVESAAAAVNDFLAGFSSVYCCIDMAVLDIGHAAGTRDVNVGGLTPEQLVGVLAELDCDTRLRGLVLTNVAPERDLRAQTEFAAARALTAVLTRYLFDESRIMSQNDE